MKKLIIKPSTLLSGDSVGELEDAIEILKEVSEDQSVPKNIRRAAEDASKRLNGMEESISVKVNAATSLLDDVSSDPNMPFHTRTLIMEAAGLLESASRTKNI